MSIKKKEIIYFIGVLFIAFAVSPLCVFVMTKFLSFNFSELFLFPGFALIAYANSNLNNLFRKQLKKKVFGYPAILLFLFFILGTITGKNIVYCYGDFRTIFVFLFFTTLTVKQKHSQVTIKKFIYHIFIILSVLDFIFLIFRNSIFLNDEQRFIVMTVCPFVISILFLNKGKLVYAAFFFAVLLYETVVSTMRLNYILIIFFFVYLVFIVGATLFNKNLSFIKTAIFISLLVLAGIKITPIIIDFLKSDGSRNLHSIVRTEKMVNNFEESESIRINTTFLFLKEPNKLILPQGIGWRNHVERIQLLFRTKYGVLSTMDSNIFYCIYHFGLIFGIVIIVIFFRFIIKLILYSKKVCSLMGFAYYLILGGIVLSMFFLKSWIFVYLNFGFIYSLLIILMRYPDNELLKQKNIILRQSKERSYYIEQWK